MPVSKVVLNDVVKLDLTADTVAPETLAEGVTAHDAAGNQITGTLQSPADAVSQHNIDPSAHDGILEPAFTDAQDKTVSFTEASEKANVSTGDKLSVIMGKIAKWFSSFGSAAWKGVGTGADDVAAGDHTHDGYIPTSEKGAASGVATLNANKLITPAQSYSDLVNCTGSTTIATYHFGNVVRINSDSAIVITIPTGIPIYTEIELFREGAGAVTLSPASGVTVLCKESNYGIADQYTSVVLKWVDTNLVAIEGNVG